MTQTMKAVRIHGYDGIDGVRYEDVPRPKQGDNQVLIRVRAAGVNPIDWMFTEGYGKDIFKHQFPLTLGWELAGTIEEAAETSRFKAGDEVFTFTTLMGQGGDAEFAAVDEAAVALKPASLDFINAATIPVGTLTAWQAIFDTANLQAGQTVLIHGAAGGVGSLAVQLAKWKGARIFATASGRNHEFVSSLGADEVIDYTKTKFEDTVKDADVVFDTIGGDTQERSFDALKKGGFLVSVVSPPSDEKATEHGVRATMIAVEPNGERLAEIARLVDEGHIKPNVEAVMHLNQVKEAFAKSRDGHTRGKIVLQVEV